MGVNRKLLLIILVLYRSISLEAQDGKKSFSFDEEVLPSVVIEIVESYGLYVSFDPSIFQGEPPVSYSFKSSGMGEALSEVLGEAYSYQIINEYVVINPREDDNQTILPPVQSEGPVTYDTLTIEQTRVFYDTIQIENLVKVKVYDTVRIERPVMIYDTVFFLPQKLKKEHQFLAYLAPTYWYKDDGSLTGASLGFSYRRKWKDFYVEGGVSYNHSLQNVNFVTNETSTELQVDTISNFFIIEQGVRVPVYVIDSTFVENDLIRETDRTNIIHQLSLQLLIGKSWVLSRRMALGVNLGISMDWVFRSNDETEGFNFNPVEPDPLILPQPPVYRMPLQNLRLELPLRYSARAMTEGYFLAPYGEWGLNTDYKNGEGSERYRLGLKLGVFF